MVGRVLPGQQPNGNCGIWVSKPGYEVIGASDFDCQFSSQYAHMRFIGAGQVAIGATGEDNGEQVVNVGFDKSYSSPLPIVLALAKSAEWRLGLHTNDGGGTVKYGQVLQHQDLENNWNTQGVDTVCQTPSYIYSGSGTNAVGYPGTVSTIKVPIGWAAFKFRVRINSSYVQFAACNTYQTVYVKYLMFDPTTG